MGSTLGGCGFAAPGVDGIGAAATVRELPAMTDSDEIRRKRLLFRSWHRGTREADLLLGSFAERHLAEFSGTDLDNYERLLEENDADLWDWLTGQAPAPAQHDSPLLRRIQSFKFTARPA
jgi:antitoxin CptB